MQFSGKFGVFTPPLEGSRPPPRENPGSATGLGAKRLPSSEFDPPSKYTMQRITSRTLQDQVHVRGVTTC